jgi:hypothetical protein
MRGRTEAVYNEDENGKRNMHRNICMRMKCVENHWKQQNRGSKSAVNIFRSLMMELEGTETPSYLKSELEEKEENQPRKSP